MSDHVRFSRMMANGQMGTAYAPSAEGSAEGNRGWPPEQRPTHWMGTSYAPAAEGSAEGDILAALNVTSSEVGPREDDPDLGVSAYDELKGLREDDADIRMMGLREDDADLRMRGLREEDADLRMYGLREDDADLRMGRTGDAGSGAEGYAEGSAEGLRTQQLGEILVTDGRSGRMMGVSAYNALGVSAYDIVMKGMGTSTQYPEELGVSAYDLRGLREDDANLRMGGLREDDANLRMGGLREDDANLRMGGLREEDAGIRMGVSAYDTLEGLREQDSNLVLLSMCGLREDDAGLRVGSIRTAMMLRGLADPEEMIMEIGRRRAFWKKRFTRPGHKKFMKGDESMGVSAYDERMGISAYDRLGAEDFHPRFPAVMIDGLGTMDGIFDFLKSAPSPEEYMGKVKLVLTGWNALKPRLMALPAQSRNAIINQMTALKNDPARYDGLAQFLAEGYAGYQASPGRWDRVKRLEAYLPTVQHMVDQSYALGPAPTPAEEQSRVNQQAATNIQDRINSTEKPSFLQEVAPYAAGAIGAGAIAGLIIAFS